MLKIGLIGLGRTGNQIAKLLLQQNDMRLVMVICSENSSKKGKDIGKILNIRDTGIIVDSCDNIKQNIFKYKPDVCIDFSTPQATIRNAQILANMKVRMVIGTTGFTKIQTNKLRTIAKNNKVGIVYAPNITLGVNVLMVLANIAASILNEYDCVITEAHFKEKKDSPSGTAKKIAKEVLKGKPDKSNKDIPINSIRAGGIIGSHKVVLAGKYDKIEISHESFSREVFALGALKAAKFVYGKTGFYEMNDVLNLQRVIAKYLDKEIVIQENELTV